MPNRRIRSCSHPRLPARRHPRALGAIAGALFAAGALACGGGDEAAPPNAGSAGDEPRVVGAPSDETTRDVARDAETQANLLQGTLPDGFPDDVPIYPGAQAESALSLSGTSFVTFTTSASGEDVLGFYRRELQDEGWSVSDGGGGLNASKEARKVHLKAKASGQGTQIAVSITGG